MTALSNVTQQTSPSLLTTFEVNHEETATTKKISQLMLELFASLMPTLQELGRSAREFGSYNHKHFLENASAEGSHRMNLGWVSLTQLISAVPQEKDNNMYQIVGSAVSGFGKSFFESTLSPITTSKEIQKDLFSKAGQDQSTLQSIADKLLSLVQQIIHAEKLVG